MPIGTMPLTNRNNLISIFMPSSSIHIPFIFHLNCLLFLIPFFPISIAQFPFQSPHCADLPDDPICQLQSSFAGSATQQQPPFCNYQDLWLIPGKADASCTRQNARRLVEMDAKHVQIHPPIVKFPGCFTVEIRNVRILAPPNGATGESVTPNGMENSIFAKTEYQWLNVRGSEIPHFHYSLFMNAKCQNASANGCGGFGNNCYYCDICESLKKVDEEGANPSSGSEVPSGIAQQLKGMNCPTEPGFYTFRKQFCFNDWRWLDTNGDCRLDFLSESEDQSGLRAAMAALQQVGYGTVVAKVRLAYNASAEVLRKKALKEAQIERSVNREMDLRASATKMHGSSPSEDARRRHWYAEQRKGQWHRDEYLPWLLYENEVACIRLTFDVCERQPQKRWDGTGGYTCI